MTDAAFALDDSPLPQLPPRAAESHKGTYGRALVVGGSRGMSGAVALAGIAALRGGAGLVQLAVPVGVQSTVAGIEPSYLTADLAEDHKGRIAAAARDKLEQLAIDATAVACGPGLGRSAQLTQLVGWFYTQLDVPAVFDADALNALAESPDRLRHAGGPRVLTPHPGEFARLVGLDAADVRGRREAVAAELAARTGAVVVLKGHRTCTSDGRRVTINTTGNPGMASGGTGDVLTGLLCALLCQGLDAYDAARLAVYVHGLAGDLAAERVGQTALMASDLPDYLPAALMRHAASA